MKAVFVIAALTLTIICGAITAIVGGAMGIAVSAAALHKVIDG